MTAAKTARLEYLLSIEFPTPLESVEMDQLINEGQDEFDAEMHLRESEQGLWAERGGYAAGIPRPL